MDFAMHGVLSTPTVGNLLSSHMSINSYSRLDYFLVSSSLLSDISDTEIHPIAVSDHAAVSLTLVNKKASPPSNNWRFNTSLLKDDDFIKYLKKSGLYI